MAFIGDHPYYLIGSLIGIILSFLIGIAIGKAMSFHPPRNVRVHFLPDRGLPCRAYVNQITGDGFQTCGLQPGGRRWRTDLKAKPCDKLHGYMGEQSALMEIMSTMGRARRSIDVCVYLFTLWDIHDILVALTKKRGIVVRIITDSTDNEEKKRSNKAQMLKDAGIRVKTNPVAKMHNKFVIVDRQVAILGSTNWTADAFTRNDEALIKTRQPVIVRAFSEKFNSMWGEMSDYSQPGVRVELGENNQRYRHN